MLHQQTEDVVRIQQVFMFMTNQVYKEVSTEQDREGEVMREAFQTLGKQMKNVAD